MAENSKIEWTEHTFNGWIGCTKVGPGCDHCYAEALATTRLGVPWGTGAPRRRTAASTWQQPRRWDRKAKAEGTRPRVFCSSLADVFDNEVDPQWRADLARLIEETPNLDWLLLTKRIGNAPAMLYAMFPEGTPANIRIGATIVNQAEWDRDVAKIAAVSIIVGKARVFLSMEPLLGPVIFEQKRYRWQGIVGWVIAGGESGKDARPMHPAWARGLRDQCEAAGVPFLFKQWGEWSPAGPHLEADTPKNLRLRKGDRAHVFPDHQQMAWIGKKAAGRQLDGRTHDGLPA